MAKEKKTSEKGALQEIYRILKDNEAGGKLKVFAIACDALGVKGDSIPGSQVGQQ